MATHILILSKFTEILQFILAIRLNTLLLKSVKFFEFDQFPSEVRWIDAPIVAVTGSFQIIAHLFSFAFDAFIHFYQFSHQFLHLFLNARTLHSLPPIHLFQFAVSFRTSFERFYHSRVTDHCLIIFHPQELDENSQELRFAEINL